MGFEFNPKISLILCTVDRNKEVKEFLQALSLQSYQNFELIIVDQNITDIVYNLYLEFKTKFNCIYVKNDMGLSKSRNVGMKYISGDIFGFPDDDCTYSSAVLNAVADFFSSSNAKNIVFSCNTIDKDSGHSLIQSPKDSCSFDKNNLLGCSFTLFFSKSLKEIKFDERLGVGCNFIWGAAEESDFCYHALSTISSVGYFKHDIYVYHPAKINALNRNRAYYYGAGLGAYRMKNFKKIYVLKSMLGLCIKLGYSLFVKPKFFLYNLFFLTGYTVGAITWRVVVR